MVSEREAELESAPQCGIGEIGVHRPGPLLSLTSGRVRHELGVRAGFENDVSSFPRFVID
jgi:hypothetical protein